MSQGEPGLLRVVTRPHGGEGVRPDPIIVDDSATIGEGLPSPGRYIKEQRQRRGMSVEQLAAATKIPRTSVILLEEDRFDELPGPVFVKGFLRCAARALGVDVDAVMELLYERERAQLHHRRRDRPSLPARASEVAGAVVAATDGVLPRMPPRVRKQSQP